MMTAQIEHESPNILEGQVECPNERNHLFSNMTELHNWVSAFNITNYNVRSGYRQDNGAYTLQLTYAPVNN